MNLRSETLQKWWPTTQSLDLVEGSVDQVASAVEKEVRRFISGESIVTVWASYQKLDSAFVGWDEPSESQLVCEAAGMRFAHPSLGVAQ